MTNAKMAGLAKIQLALDMNCQTRDFDGDADSFVFVLARENLGRRPFPRAEHHLEMLTMGGATVVSATPELLARAKQALAGKNRDDAFAAPFVQGHALYYLPDLDRFGALPAPEGFDCELAERGGMAALYESPGFRNALGYDLAHPRPDMLAMVARRHGAIVGVAGASADCEALWQIGIDVLPAFRDHGLAAYLTNRLALDILRRGKAPYYGTSSSNIPSQRVAHRAGFAPAWVCAYRTRFDGYDAMPVG